MKAHRPALMIAMLLCGTGVAVGEDAVRPAPARYAEVVLNVEGMT